MDDQKNQALERLKQANNILVTVSSNPTVDQLSAVLGFTLFLNKLDKHATAVYSGKTPSTIEFLKPEKTLEKNTDSLRDFIISLDKSKADKLRYKVEDDHVKVFITPYRTSITEADLEFSQGDFNVEVVVALGVSEQRDLDQAITAHGRILHDATVISVTTGAQSALGSINWSDAKASSLSEMMADLSDSLSAGTLDNQMATAFLTGIVAETARFSNEKTSPKTMTLSAKLMAAGANQQLVATELQKTAEVAPVVEEESEDTFDSSGGTLEIGHDDVIDLGDGEEPEAEQATSEVAVDTDNQEEIELPEVNDTPVPEELEPEPEPSEPHDDRRVPITEPPQLGGVLTASGRPEDVLDPQIDPLAGGQPAPLLSHDEAVVQDKLAPDFNAMPEDAPQAESSQPQIPEQQDQPVSFDLPQPPPQAEPVAMPLPPAPEPVAETPPQAPVTEKPGTLAELEQTVGSPHQDQDSGVTLPDGSATPTADVNGDGAVNVNEARDAVMQAITESTQPLPPIQALNAQPIELQPVPPEDGAMPGGQADLGLPPSLIPDDVPPVDTTAASVQDPTAPPPVPPPMMPPMPGMGLPASPSQMPPMPPQQDGQAQDQNNPFGLPSA